MSLNNKTYLYRCLFYILQRAIKEKEFELVTVKNQKLENLCRALQDERRNLYEKLQKAAEAAPQPESTGSEAAEEEVKEASAAPQDDHPVQDTAAPAGAAAPESPLAGELVKLKAEQARLKEIASSFTVSHVLPAESVLSQSQQLSDGVQEAEDSCTEEIQEDTDEGHQKQRELEMESVD